MDDENRKQKKINDEHVKRRSAFFAGWMNKLAAAYGVEATEERQAVYLDALADLAIGELERAFRQCLNECKFFPAIAEIRAAVEKTYRVQDQFDAEKAWDWVKQIIRKHWFGEWMPVMSHIKPEHYSGHVAVCRGGYLLYPPAFDGITEYAIRQVGGIERIINATDENHDFIRRGFLEAFKRHRETGGYLAPSRLEATALLDKLRRKELPE